jgi:hypothetical protein
MTATDLCADYCVSNGDTLYSEDGGCYPDRITAHMNFSNLTPGTTVVARFTVRSSQRNQSWEFPYVESNRNGQSYAYLDAPLEPGRYTVEWGVSGGYPLASATYFLSCN